MPKAKLGMYFYQPSLNSWGVWQYTMVNEHGTCASKVKTFMFREDAVKYVYEMNGWNKKIA